MLPKHVVILFIYFFGGGGVALDVRAFVMGLIQISSFFPLKQFYMKVHDGYMLTFPLL